MNRFRLRWGPGLLVLAVLLALLLPLVARAQASGGEKFDAVLKTVMASPDGVRTRGGMIGLPARADETSTVKVAVKVTDDGRELEGYLRGVGGRVTSHHGPVLVASLPYHALADLGALPSVTRVEANTALLPSNDLARQPAGANVNALVQANPGLTGRGVLVGVIDTGVDTALEAFKDEDGRSRILYYWTQATDDATRRPTVTLPEGGTRTYDYGSEWTAADINNGAFDMADPDYHGTHVAGTIGGRDAAYPGMAPEVRYLVVANDGNRYEDMWQGAGTGDTLDAYEYLVSRARELGLPLVTNQSQGTCMGPHDGSTLFEQALQADIDSLARNLVPCISAGNNQSRSISARVTVPANGEARVRLRLAHYESAYDGYLYNSLDIWSRGGARPTLTVDRYSNNTFTTLLGSSGPIAYAAQGTFNTDSNAGTYNFQLAKELPSNLNGDDRVLMTDAGPDYTYRYLELVFTNASGTASTVDLYLQRNTDSRFYSNFSTATLGMPGSLPGAISVAAYTTRNSFVDADGNTQDSSAIFPMGGLAYFSSNGPARTPDRYTGLNAWKPDLAAPGANVASQKSRGAAVPNSLLTQDGQHLVISGTSMSTPVVTGLVALMLQEAPNARVADLKAALFARARSDASTGAVPNNAWGHGKADLSALDALVSPTPSLRGAQRVNEDPGTVRVLGENFALSCQVLVDGVLWPAEQVQWISPREILLTGVRTEPVIQTIQVVNLRAPEGARTATLVVNSPLLAGAASGASAGSGCFIATAAWGSPLEPEVMALRRFRDRHLVTNVPGRYLVGLYYRWSPAAADVIAHHPALRTASRVALTPVVLAVGHPGPALGLALAAGALGALAWRRRRRAA